MPKEIEVFHYPKAMKWVSVASASSYGILGLLPALLFLAFPTNSNVLPMFLLCATLSFTFLWVGFEAWKGHHRLDDRLVLCEGGITRQSGSGAEEHFPWTAMAEIRTRAILQRIEIRDSSRRPLLSIEFQLKDFDRLRDAIMDETFQFRVAGRSGSNFQPSWWVSGFAIGSMGFYAFLAFLAFSAGQTGAGIGFLAFVAFSMLAFSWEGKSVSLSGDRIKIGSLVRSETIRYSEILDVGLTRIRHSHHAVVVKRTNGKSVELPQTCGGPVVLHDEIHRRWKVRCGGPPSRDRTG